MSLVSVATRLYATLEPHAVLIGGICGAMHGVERFTRDVDMATDLSAAKVVSLLKKAGIDSEIQHGEATDALTWVVKGICEDIEFQIIPASDVGVSLDNALLRVELGIASEKDYITSKCIAGGQQDLHDVAVLVMLNKRLRTFATDKAERHGCKNKLDAWLTDERLLARYGART